MKNPKIPLHLYEVLEEEFISLHGPIDDRKAVEVELPKDGSVAEAEAKEEAAPRPETEAGVKGRVAEAKRDWDFLKGHVKSPANFARDVLEEVTEESMTIVRDARAPQAYDWAKWNLKNYLRGKKTPEGEKPPAAPLNEETLRALAATHEGVQPDPARVRELETQLNAVLRDENLYDGDRFSDSWLSDGTRGLVDLHTTSAKLTGGDLRHMNRLLLEDAFPDFIEPLKNIRLAAIYQRIHNVRPSALSLSGGGIRSGTFALGVMQGLARHKLLQRFDYLSTVSGGGYMGSWLSAWLHRHPEGLAGVTREMTNEDPSSKVDPDPKPIQHLRNYSNFITPKVGMLTADTWTFIGIYVRNLLLNWMVFIPLMLALLMLPRLMVGVTLWQPVNEPKTLSKFIEDRRVEISKSTDYSPDDKARMSKDLDKLEKEMKEADERDSKSKLKDTPRQWWVVYSAASLGDLWGRLKERLGWRAESSPPDSFLHKAYPRHLLLLTGFVFGVWALGYVGFNRPAARELLRRRSRRWRDRTDQRSFLLLCLLPLTLSAVCLTTYWAWSREVQMVAHDLYYYTLFGLAFTLAGWIITAYVLGVLSRPSEINWPQLALILIVGAVGGLIFLAFSYQELLGEPVLGYGVLPRDGEIVQTPIEWTNWGAWATHLHTEIYVCIGVPVFLLTFWLAVTLFVGLSSRSPRIDDDDREWWARFGAWLLIASIVWMAFNAVVLFGPIAVLSSPKLLASVGGLSGLVAVLLGRSSKTPARGKTADDGTKSEAAAGAVGSILPLLALVFLALLLSSLSLLTSGATRYFVATYAKEVGPGRVPAHSVGNTFGEWMTNIPAADLPTATAGETALTPWQGFGQYVDFIAPVLTPLPSATPAPTPDGQAAQQQQCVNLVCVPRGGEEAKALAEAAAAESGDEKDPLTGAKLVHMNVLHHTSLKLMLPLSIIFFMFGWLMSRFINLNKFSLHAGYRDRLIRGFLGASRPPGERKPNPFTGFDPADNVSMHELRWALFNERDIIDPKRLEAEMRNRDNPVSNRLFEMGLMGNLEMKPGPADVATLRGILNDALEGEALYAAGAAGRDKLESPRGRRLQAQILDTVNEGRSVETAYDSLDGAQVRGDYHLLLNRLVLEEAYPKLVRLGQPPPYKLLHVINTTLNLVGGDKLAWQQRKAEPFSISPLHSGCFRVGYRDSREYGGRGGITIGTAAATSGAAASSNMGYYTTSPVISLLLTFFNVRLGWWLGNPGTAGRDTYRLSTPKYSVVPVLAEALGLTNDSSPYVYLTDGGHFENLALYEMVLRRCHVIVVSDAAADPDYQFGDLGNAVRKIRIDLGVPIEFPCVPIYGADEAAERRKDKKGVSYIAVGRIRYSCVDRVAKEGGEFEPAPDGVIIYIKPAVYGDEPRDVTEYKKSNPVFPHQSTGDQFFDEPQFESYRALGSFISDKLCGTGFDTLDIPQMVGLAFQSARHHCPEAFVASDTDKMPDPKTDPESFKLWLDGVRDKSLRGWLEELAEVESPARVRADKLPPTAAG